MTDPAEKWKARTREIVSSEPNLNHAARMENAIFAAQAAAYAAGRFDGKREVYDLLDAAQIDDGEIRIRARGVSHD